MAAKTVMLLSDGRPGHFRQAEAIALALSRRIEIKVDRIELPPPRIFPRRLGRYAALALPPALVLKSLYGVDAASLAKPDAIVSAGGNTLAANVALAKIFGVPNIYAGTPRHIGAKMFALVLTPYRSVAGGANTAYALKPCALDPDTLPSPKRWPAKPFRMALLIGGPTPAADFRLPDWQALAALMQSMANDLGVRFVLATSRRTPKDFHEAFDPLLARAEVIERYIDHREAGTGSVAAAYETDAILVTSDSLSMITEGCAARRPVIVLTPAITKPFRDNEAVEALAAGNRLAVVPLSDATPATITAKLTTIEPMRENHLDRLGSIVLRALETH